MTIAIDKNIYLRPVELLQQLIRFDTTNPPGNERECMTYIHHLLCEAGIETHVLSKDPHRPNVVARIKGKKETSPLLLYGHVDVVGAGSEKWTYPPFEGRIADGYVWGRGALDMKGAVSMMLSAFIRAKVENIHLPGDVVLCLLSDEEELGEYGAQFLVESHPELFKGIRYAVGEFGGFSLHVGGKTFYPIEVAQKQKCGFKAVVHGPSGHGSSIVKGGATVKLARFLECLDKHLLPVHITPPVEKMFKAMARELPFPSGWIMKKLLDPRWTDFILKLLGEKGKAFIPMFRNTANPTIIRGGEKNNVIPGEIEVHLDVRLLPGFKPADVEKELRSIVRDDVELRFLFYNEERGGEPDLAMFETLSEVLREMDPTGIPVPFLLTGCSDARFFSRLGIQTYGFMPMKLPSDLNFNRLIHSVDERIPVDTLAFGTEALFKVLQRPTFL